ncbi:Aste57867_18987 [Aphanomyces stellatus]|uniref:Aste57867_18987 protein n=1 Tax=Aphanomyces stellatus TaxID=120398 RepID=A0A485LCZ2_9STRA|nr:hypothetical protein As57867_018923 [Aphanomyces stellatus]VFT95713.1 Aste57867_18987 [Aphanomyces stellatus]
MTKSDAGVTTEEVSGPDDVHQQAELLVMDYLRGSRYMKTMDALSKWISDKAKKKPHRSMASAPTASDIFAKDVAANKASKDHRANSVLEFMIGVRKSNKSPKVSCSPESGAYEVKSAKCDETSRVTVATAGEWTKAELAQLKKEAKKTQGIADKTERWRAVGAALGRSKRECYDKYKELRRSKSPKDRAHDDRAMLDLSVEVQEESKASGGSSPTYAVAVHYLKAAGKDTSSKTSPTKKKNKIDVTAANESDQLSWASDAKPKARSAVAPGDTRSSMPPKRASRDDEAAVMEDCDGDLLDDDKATDVGAKRTASASLTGVSTGAPSCTARGKALPAAEVAALRKLLFNDPKKKLSSHWTHQGFPFSTVPGLGYGIIQHEGGPCGVMAVVQGYVLFYLLKDGSVDNATPSQLQKALVQALTHIIWQAANGLACKVALTDHTGTPSLDHMVVSQLQSRHDLEQFVSSHVDQFAEAKGYGVVLLVASVMLSRGLAIIEGDMDTATGIVPTLIGNHDYCTQEMVNLLLVGYAASNVFDGFKDLGGDAGDAMLLRGIQKRGLVGFLTLFEAYDYMVVGDHLKVPVESIWVVCSESHYSVFFVDPSKNSSTSDELGNAAPFDLIYFDGLANQDEVIRLSVHPYGLASKPEKAQQKDLVPPLNLVIQTKWPCAIIDWNGTDPLL